MEILKFRICRIICIYKSFGHPCIQVSVIHNHVYPYCQTSLRICTAILLESKTNNKKDPLHIFSNWYNNHETLRSLTEFHSHTVLHTCLFISIYYYFFSVSSFFLLNSVWMNQSTSAKNWMWPTQFVSTSLCNGMTSNRPLFIMFAPSISHFGANVLQIAQLKCTQIMKSNNPMFGLTLPLT